LILSRLVFGWISVGHFLRFREQLLSSWQHRLLSLKAWQVALICSVCKQVQNFSGPVAVCWCF
jgi:hypothetical protein